MTPLDRNSSALALAALAGVTIVCLIEWLKKYWKMRDEWEEEVAE